MSLRQRLRQIVIPEGGALRLVVLSDSHGRPHWRSVELIDALEPDHILHAGDVGDLEVLATLERLAPTIAVRGNVDARGLGLPDQVIIELGGSGQQLRLLLIHIAIGHYRLIGAVRQMALEAGAGLVVCGHSHIPWLGKDGDIAIFNPGSHGPRRFDRPVTLGLIEVSARGVELRHFDCETGQRWEPEAGRRS